MRRSGSAIPAPRSPSCWWARACTRCRPWALRSPPTSSRWRSSPRVVGLMYVMLLVGMIAAALIFGYLLQDYTPGKLVARWCRGAAVVTIALNLLALWKQEPRDLVRAPPAWRPRPMPISSMSWRSVRARQDLPWACWSSSGRSAPMGFFGMADVLLEPYGGQVLDLSVAMTTAADRRSGAWRAHRFRHRLARAAERPRSDRRGVVGHACGHSRLRRHHRGRSAGANPRFSWPARGLPGLARVFSVMAR